MAKAMHNEGEEEEMGLKSDDARGSATNMEDEDPGLKSEISAEHFPQTSREGSLLSLVQSDPGLGAKLLLEGPNAAEQLKNLSEEELTEKLENILLEKIREGNKDALFQLGQLYFEEDQYEKAIQYFQRGAEKGDIQAIFQLGVMYYDGVACKADHKKGLDYMKQVLASPCPKAKHLMRFAQYNVGRAYYQGYGVRQSDQEAERHWLAAADDGSPKASIKAQTMLGMYYCRDESRNLKKAFFWHSEACGNGSLESQGALGTMYLYGLGIKKDADAAFLCLREAAERGNVYAMGNLISYYYNRKLYTKTVELAARVSTFDHPEQIGAETECLPSYVAKGISMSCFYYARCLHLGHGIQKNEEEAKKYYSRSYHFDPDMCARLQHVVTHGQI